MSNVSNAPPGVYAGGMTNALFLATVFGTRWTDSHVTAFGEDPIGAVPGVWSGWKTGRRLERLEQPGANTYVTVSLLRDDPDTGANPRRAAGFDGLYLVCVDDVGVSGSAKLDPAVVLAALTEPTYRLETSPGNEQWGYVLERPERDVGRADALIHGLIRALAPGGKDPGMASVVRYVRMPIGTNTKASLGPGGFVHVLRTWDKGRMFLADEIAVGIKLELPEPGLGRVSAPVRPVSPGQADADTVLAAMRELGHVQGLTSSGWGYHCTCPCAASHSDPEAQTGTAYRPGAWGRRGAWKCHHGHCEDREWGSFVAGLDDGLARAGLATMRVREFEALEPADAALQPPDPGPRASFLAEMVFVLPENAFYSLRAQAYVPRHSVNLDYAKDLAGHTTSSSTDPATGKVSSRTLPVDVWFARQDDHQVADALVYWPGEGARFVRDRINYLNTYRAPVLDAGCVGRVSNGMVRPWLDLVEHVLGAEGGRAVVRFLDWCAGVVGSPGLKPSWLVLVWGLQGVGKDLMMTPVVQGVGVDNVAAITGDQLGSEFTGYAARRLVLISELRQTTRGAATGHDQYNRIKSLVDNTQATIPINPKYGRQYVARNTCAIFTSTNDQAAMALERDDRRAMVLMSEATPWPAARYARFAAWRDEEQGGALVAQWLAERWERMGGARRAALSGRAPWTRGKGSMIQATEDPVLAWVRQGIEDGSSPEWPDLISSEDVVANVSRALAGGVSGLPRHLRAPTVDRAGRMLAGLGAVRAAGGQPVRLKGGRRVRLWAIRNHGNLVTLGGGAVGRLVDAGKLSGFEGSQIVAGNFSDTLASVTNRPSETLV